MDAMWWCAIAGCVGGLLNATTSHNLFLWPFRVPSAGVVVPGLVANVLIGGSASLAGVRALCGAAGPQTTPAGNLALTLLAALVAGGLAARWLTSQADVRLLRAAASRACAAPAAHPDTARAIETASPYEVFQTAADLVPKFRSFR
jgi:hypothetical protein